MSLVSNTALLATIKKLQERIDDLEYAIESTINQVNFLSNNNQVSHDEMWYYCTNTIDCYHSRGVVNYQILHASSREVVQPARVVLNYGHIHIQLPITSDYILILY